MSLTSTSLHALRRLWGSRSTAGARVEPTHRSSSCVASSQCPTVAARALARAAIGDDGAHGRRTAVVRRAGYLVVICAAGLRCDLAAAQDVEGASGETSAADAERRTQPPTTADQVPHASEAGISERTADVGTDAGVDVPPSDASAVEKPSRPSSLSLPSKPTDSNEPLFGTFEGTYALGGISTGVTFAPAGFVLGAELSLVRQTQEFAWFGAYVDGVYDFGRDQIRFSMGPELGWSAFGLDAGYLLALDDVGAHSGITARPLLSIGYVSAFGRVSHLFDVGQTWLEAGLLLKYPVEL